jgi:hypothetical protein
VRCRMRRRLERTRRSSMNARRFSDKDILYIMTTVVRCVPNSINGYSTCYCRPRKKALPDPCILPYPQKPLFPLHLFEQQSLFLLQGTNLAAQLKIGTNLAAQLAIGGEVIGTKPVARSLILPVYSNVFGDPSPSPITTPSNASASILDVSSAGVRLGSSCSSKAATPAT